MASSALISSLSTYSFLLSSLSKPAQTLTFPSSSFFAPPKPLRASTSSSLLSPRNFALRASIEEAPLVGNKAPDFEAEAVFDQEFINITLEKNVILFFYPLDFTFVCPTEVTAFSNRYAEFEKINTEILGVSIDSVFSHLAWVQTDRKSGGLGDLNYPLVSDVTKSISKSFGVLIPDQGIALRGLFIIEKEGVIQHSTINNLAIGRSSIDETLRTLQVSLLTECSKTTTISLPIKPPKSPDIPAIPSSPSPNSFQEKVLFLDSIGIDVFALINHHRRVILQSSIDDIKSTLNFLTSMNFTSAEFCRMVSMCPEILTANAAAILPVFTFLLHEAHVNGSDLKRVINRRPRLLISCVKNRLRPTLYFLQSIGIAQVNKHTYLLSCSVEDKLLPRIQCFEKLGFSYTDAVSMFRRFPQLFNYSVEDNIEPQFNYFVVEMGRELRELREFPQYFSFSLENRIKPRHQCCVEKGVCFNLKVLLKSSEAEFRQRLEICCGISVPRRGSPLSSVHSHYTHQFDTQRNSNFF